MPVLPDRTLWLHGNTLWGRGRPSVLQSLAGARCGDYPVLPRLSQQLRSSRIAAHLALTVELSCRYLSLATNAPSFAARSSQQQGKYKICGAAAAAVTSYLSCWPPLQTHLQNGAGIPNLTQIDVLPVSMDVAACI